MLHVCATRFDMTKILKSFFIFGVKGPNHPSTCVAGDPPYVCLVRVLPVRNTGDPPYIL